MANKQELEKNLINRVAKKIGKDNQTLEEVIEKIMISVDNWAQEHKKDLAGLDEKTRQEFRKPSFLLSKLIKIKYAEEKLIQIVHHNLKRAPGNLSEEQRMLAIYDTFKKFDYKCAYSDTLLLGGNQSIHLEHIIPVAMGGPTDDWNCIPICGTCNSSKKDKHLLDWWKENRKIEEEYKLVKIFEHMTSKLLDETNTIKYVKQDNNPIHLDAITFLNQLLNHIEENKQYIFNKEFSSEKEKQNAINSKLKELKSTFEKVVKKNDRNTKTDKQYFAEQKEMVKYVKSLGVSSYYKVAYTYFNTIKEMQNLGKPEEEIKEFCIAQDDWFTPFYEKLIAYKKAHNGSFDGVTQDEEIGDTVGSIRQAKKGKGRTKLTTDMIDKLNTIDFPWEREDWFTPFYEKLITYKEAHNGSFDGVATDKEIGDSINRIRKAKKGKGGTKLTTDMIDKLNTIDFPWEREDWFTPFYEKLIAYKESHNGSFDGVATDLEIGGQVNRIRQAKKGKGGTKLTTDMIDKLNTIDFPWEREDWFSPFYEKLIAYKEVHNGSFDGVATDKEIGGQVGGVRQAKKGKGSGTKLTPEMIIKLEEIGFPWEVEKEDWFTPFYEKLIAYKESHNGSFDGVTACDSEIEDKVNRIRKAKKGKGSTKLTTDMIDKLNTIDFPWEREDWFTPFYEKLIAYKESHNGSFDGVATDVEIGGQVNRIRKAKKGKGSTKLTDEMIAKLDAIDFPWEARAKKVQEDNLSV